MADTLTHFITAERFFAGKQFSDDFKRGMYFGVQGPDPFFFGDAPSSMALGDKLHDCAPKAYFETESDSIGQMDELYKGYYFGVMLHYFEDRIMHQYVGYLCRKYPSPSTHGQVEREFDIVLYSKEYGKKIKTFNVKKYYSVDDSIVDVVYRFWSKRVDDAILTREFVQTALKRCFALTSLLLRANPIVIAIVKRKEAKMGQPGVLSCHFKTGYTMEHMNLAHAQWDSPVGTYTLSVPDIVQKGVDDFSKEYELLNDCYAKGAPYRFLHTEWFSCGK